MYYYYYFTVSFEDFDLLRCDAETSGEWLPTFRIIMARSYKRAKQSKLGRITLEYGRTTNFETLETSHPKSQGHIP
jgi:hypothetical protein